MSTAFGNDANFSGISSLPLKINWVIQKAFVESNEMGTEAAGVTAVGMNGVVSSETPLPPLPAVFHADSPFLYFIRDRATGAILFIGRVAHPSDTH